MGKNKKAFPVGKAFLQKHIDILICHAVTFPSKVDTTTAATCGIKNVVHF
jgi:hypothetical protein